MSPNDAKTDEVKLASHEHPGDRTPGLRLVIEACGGDEELERARTREFAWQSRRMGIVPERMIVDLKEVLDSLPLLRAKYRRLDLAFRDMLVSLAIASYFTEPEDAPPA